MPSFRLTGLQDLLRTPQIAVALPARRGPIGGVGRASKIGLDAAPDSLPSLVTNCSALLGRTVPHRGCIWRA